MQYSQKGFTLVEVLVVVIVLSLLAFSNAFHQIGDHFFSWRKRETLRQEAMSIVALIDRARSYAIHSGKPVYMCGGMQCNGAWPDIIFLSLNLTSSLSLAGAFVDPSVHIVWRGFPAVRDYILFLPSGLSAYQNGSFYLCHEGDIALRVVVSQSGRAYLDNVYYEAEVCR